MTSKAEAHDATVGAVLTMSFIGVVTAISEVFDRNAPKNPYAHFFLVFILTVVLGVFTSRIKRALVNATTPKTLFVEWSHEDTVERLVTLVAEFGLPTVLVRAEGGYAEWNGVNGYRRVRINDDDVEYRGAREFVLVTYERVLPESMLKRIKLLSDSVFYDAVKGELLIRCISVDESKKILKIIDALAEEEIAFEIARRLMNGHYESRNGNF